MARQNGNHIGARKKLVQPALPVLPLVPSIKRGSAKIKEIEESQSNGVGPMVVPAASSEQSSAQTPPVSSTSTSLQEIQQAQPDDTLPSGVVGPRSLPAEQVQISYDASDSTQDDLEPILQAQHAIVPSAIVANNELDAINTTSSIKLLADSPARIHDAAATHPEDPQDDTSTMQATLASEHMVHVDSDAAPEAVTGQPEQVFIPQHSTHPSIDSSIQDTPKYTVVVPSSPDHFELSSHRALANGNASVASNTDQNSQDSATNQVAPDNGESHQRSGVATFPTIPLYIRNLQYAQEWYDCELCVYFAEAPKPAIYRNAHSLVLIRSERLRSFIFPQRVSNYSYYIINLAPARPIGADAFDAALKFLYEDNVLSADRIILPYTDFDRQGRLRAFDYVVSYLISGLELGLEPVTTRALDLIGRLLDWDLAERTVKEAMVLRSSSAPDVNPHAPRDAIIAAKSMIQHVCNLVILRLDPKHFNLDTGATATDLAPRFANTEVGRTSFNPALANMVFGSMPASTNLSPASSQEVFSPFVTSSPETVASIVMLNLDFEDLALLVTGMNNVHSQDGLRVMNEVVEERERRRAQILTNRSISNKQRTANSSIWETVGRREYITDSILQQERASFLLSSKRNGNV